MSPRTRARAVSQSRLLDVDAMGDGGTIRTPRRIPSNGDSDQHKNLSSSEDLMKKYYIGVNAWTAGFIGGFLRPTLKIVR